MNRPATILPLVLLAAACAPVEPPQRTPRAEAAIDKALTGRVAETPQSCVSLSQIRSTRIIDDRTILIEGHGGVVWRNDPPGGCAGLQPHRTIVTRSSTTQHCRGDIFQIVDLPGPMSMGSCSFGDFVPYRKAG